jgi:hypothetical protein
MRYIALALVMAMGVRGLAGCAANAAPKDLDECVIAVIPNTMDSDYLLNFDIDLRGGKVSDFGQEWLASKPPIQIHMSGNCKGVTLTGRLPK